MFLFKTQHTSITAVILASLLSASTTTVNANDNLTITLGTKASPATIAAADLSITPDGDNLPTGSGTATQGKKVFTAQCASCHGADAKGGEGLADPLVGGIGTLATDAPIKTVGSFWPYTSTLFDYIRRAMPLNAPLSLSNNQVYAVSAFILSENGIITPTAVMNAQTLPKVTMPNHDGFVSDWKPHKHTP
jgi:cytochrome c